MEFVIVFVAIAFAYFLGRRHGRKAVQRKVRGSFDWLQ